jgi:uncharacterized protein YndB with AHSA1/START domain
MSQSAPHSTVDTVHLQREFSASPERLFNAWTRPEMLNDWFGPEGFRVIESSATVEVGGKYRIVIESPQGVVIEHFGEYVDVSRYNRLVFTWVLDDQRCVGSENQRAITLVTLRFDALATERVMLDLLHERLPDRTARDGHLFDWTQSLESLAHFIESVS